MKRLLALYFAIGILISPFLVYASDINEQLFDNQIQTLKDRGVSSGIIQKLEAQKDAVLKKANTLLFGIRHIQFLPVIPNSSLSIEKQMEMVQNGIMKGKSYLESSNITTVVQTPKEPYYIFDVEDGTATLGTAPQGAVKQFTEHNRSPLTAEEGIALVLHYPVILRHHYINLPGSRHGDDEVTALWLSGGKPKLNWDWAYDSAAKWGSASCGSRWHFVP